MTYTILHADDDSVIRTFVKRTAESLKEELGSPIEIISAEDGREALTFYNLARNEGKKISLVITDYNMPHVNGVSVVNAVRSQDSVPIVFHCTEAQKYAKEYDVEYAEKGTGFSDVRELMLKYLSPKPRILIAEDEKLLREALIFMFSENGYSPVTAQDAESALPHIPSVHAVLSDINQPNSQGGYWLLEEARKRYSHEKLPFFLMSTQHDIDLCITHGAYPVSKPVQIAALEMLVRNSLPQHLRPRGAA